MCGGGVACVFSFAICFEFASIYIKINSARCVTQVPSPATAILPRKSVTLSSFCLCPAFGGKQKKTTVRGRREASEPECSLALSGPLGTFDWHIP
jgi:hypothetical protein